MSLTLNKYVSCHVLPQGTAASTKNKLPGLITSMETVGAKALEDFADNIKVPATPFSFTRPGLLIELLGLLREQAFKRVRFAL